MADLQDAPEDTSAVGELGPNPGPPGPPAPVPEYGAECLDRARNLLAAYPVADGHNTLAKALGQIPWHDLEVGESGLDTDIPRLRAGRVGAQFWALTAEADCPDPAGITLDRLDRIRSLIASYPEWLRLALTGGDLADARNCGRIASFLGPVTAHALGDSLGTLRAYHLLGVRVLALGPGTRWTEPGLTRFGLEVVREANRLGMLLDLSGAEPGTWRRTIDNSKAPALLSRSAAASLTKHPLNASDELLAELGTSGGVCLVSFDPEQIEQGGRPVSVRDVADHIERVRDVAGPSHVGLAGTFGLVRGAPRIPGLEDASCYPTLIAELLGRGWTEPEIGALTWENFARVVRDVEFTARATAPRRTPSKATIEDLDGP
ncbi:dipeptidase [Streptomyces violascens]|uniref:Dipeptidase n=1 Tax=Streptomyces violascens TaxID=67381 RepID=A0ABQ3QR64_9ACTN|nr:dipeptidase [Streptomyces violascens]GGT97914.1 dipeptidase [Streptomyces violascens]GHI39771.1 dipeptidase [Streptomyces violascens]